MKEEKDYLRDIAEIRSMMERSSKFLSLSGWAGAMAGIYALVGAYIAYEFLKFSPSAPEGTSAALSTDLNALLLLAVGILVLAIGSAVYLSGRNARKRGEKLWNPTVKRVLIQMAVPLVTGGLVLLVLLTKGLLAFLAPFSLIFYGLALYNASKFTYAEVRSLGLIQVGLGLMGLYLVQYGLILWALGFGVVHIIYGVYMHFRYER